MKHRAFPLVLLVLLPLLLGSRCRKPEQEPQGADQPAPVDAELRVAAIEPSVVEAGRAFRAVLTGSGFREGASVAFEAVDGGARVGASAMVRDESSIALSVPALPAGGWDVVVTGPDGARAVLRQGLLAEVRREDPRAGLDCSVVRVHFGFDRADLTAEAQQELRRHLPCFEAATTTVVVEGHTDERGTTAYNLALGERRAEAIRRFLVGLGVPPGRIRTVSYGEERPLARGHDEEAWARNRRGEVRAGR